MVETMRFTRQEQRDGYELRLYDPCVLAQVHVRGSIEQAANLGFGPLVRYIGGNNANNQAMAMTAPVLQDVAADDNHVVSFVLPSNVDVSSIPVPADSRVTTVALPARLMAAARYRGRWTARGFSSARDALIANLERDHLVATGPALWARYDPPWTPAFMKTNEVLIPVAE